MFLRVFVFPSYPLAVRVAGHGACASLVPFLFHSGAFFLSPLLTQRERGRATPAPSPLLLLPPCAVFLRLPFSSVLRAKHTHTHRFEIPMEQRPCCTLGHDEVASLPPLREVTGQRDVYVEGENEGGEGACLFVFACVEGNGAIRRCLWISVSRHTCACAYVLAMTGEVDVEREIECSRGRIGALSLSNRLSISFCFVSAIHDVHFRLVGDTADCYPSPSLPLPRQGCCPLCVCVCELDFLFPGRGEGTPPYPPSPTLAKSDFDSNAKE